jgi:hypothetical protein
MGNNQQGNTGRRIGQVGGERAAHIAGDDDIARSIGVVNVEAPVGVIARIEREAQQPPFVAARDQGRDIQERARADVPRRNIDQPDPASLFDDKEPAHIAGWGGEIQRRRKTLRNGLELEGIGPQRRRERGRRLLLAIAASGEWRHAED